MSVADLEMEAMPSDVDKGRLLALELESKGGLFIGHSGEYVCRREETA